MSKLPSGSPGIPVNRDSAFLARPAVAALLVLAVSLMGCGSTKEPTYDGKTAAQWAEDLKSQDDKDREQTAEALGRIGPDAREAVPALVEALAKDTDAVRGAAASALGKIGAEADVAIPALVRALADPDKFVGSAAIAALKQFGQAAAPALVEVLEGGGAEARLGAADALAEAGRGDRAACEALFKAARGTEARVRVVAARSLAEADPDRTGEAVRALAEVLSAPGEDSDRSAAATALGEIRSAAAVPALKRAMKDSNPFVRVEAALALWRVQGRAEESLPVLTAVLKDRSDDTLVARSFAAIALGKMGTAARPAVDDLREALKDPLCRHAAAEALKEVEPSTEAEDGSR